MVPRPDKNIYGYIDSESVYLTGLCLDVCPLGIEKKTKKIKTEIGNRDRPRESFISRSVEHEN